jgi:nicotinamidase-related amidase
MADLLLDRTQSFLAVIDVQELFLDKLEPEARAPLVGRIAWLIRVATALDIPVIAMGEDIGRNGAPVAEVLAALPAGTPVHDKTVFGLFGQRDLRAAVAATGRSQAIITGLETDVCVAQSALGLLGAGFRVAAVTDATGSPGTAHQAGLARMRAAGATLTTAKGLYYEWLRDLETSARIKPLVSLHQPDDLVL